MATNDPADVRAGRQLARIDHTLALFVRFQLLASSAIRVLLVNIAKKGRYPGSISGLGGYDPA